ncbi:MAG: hypothetical protein GY928_15365, partial [Colwellia sp.]|nr:hypothetical protein [Colwellia sp.]
SVEHGSWKFVWEELSKSALSAEVRNTLEIKGLQWLDKVTVEHGSWPFVWQELSKSELSAEVRNALEIKGLQWLDTVSVEHGSWPFVWQELSKSALSAEVRNVLETKGFLWLDTVSVEHGSWRFVWEELSKSAISAEQQETMQSLVLKWLENVNPENIFWPFIWQNIVKKSVPDSKLHSELLNKGRFWLENTPLSHRSRPYIYGLYSAATIEFDSYLIDSGLAWLKQNTIPNSSWYLIWCPLWDQCPDIHKELGEIAIHIQGKKPTSNDGFEKVYNRLNRA